jgi:1-acyl-sn-glycerol-3-phosphate acyltransferase
VNLLYGCVSITAKLFFKIFYRHRVLGAEHLPAGSAILAPNHTSYFDPILICISCPTQVYFVARKSLFRFPIFGFLIKQLNAVPIAQEAQDTKMLKMILKLLTEGKKVVLFPEGRRTLDGRIGPLEKGISLIALRAQCPIVPTYLSGAYEVWPRKKTFPNLTGHTACTFGEPIQPEVFSHLKKRQAIQSMTEALAESLHKLEQ